MLVKIKPPLLILLLPLLLFTYSNYHGECDEDHGEQKILRGDRPGGWIRKRGEVEVGELSYLAEKRDRERGGGNDLCQQQEEHGQRKQNRDGK